MLRRCVLKGGLGIVTLAAVPFARAAVDGDVERAIRDVLGDVEAVEGGFDFDLPERADNGAFVPFTVSVDSPMTADDHVAAIHLFATRNPTPGVGSFFFSPRSGKALVSSRLRLAEDQTVLAFAVHGDGTVRRAAVAVEVGVGGCIT